MKKFFAGLMVSAMVLIPSVSVLAGPPGPTPQPPSQQQPPQPQQPNNNGVGKTDLQVFIADGETSDILAETHNTSYWTSIGTIKTTTNQLNKFVGSEYSVNANEYVSKWPEFRDLLSTYENYSWRIVNETNGYHLDGMANPHVHNYTETVVSPTCTEQGYTTYTCECGDTYNDNYVDALGHTNGEVVTENVVNATCTVPASHNEVIYCTECGDEVSRDIIIGKTLPHNYIETNRQDATCTEVGSVRYECSDCDAFYVNIIDTKGHGTTHFTEENRVEPTTTTEGSYDKVERCDVCNEIISSEKMSIDKLPAAAPIIPTPTQPSEDVPVVIIADEPTPETPVVPEVPAVEPPTVPARNNTPAVAVVEEPVVEITEEVTPLAAQEVTEVETESIIEEEVPLAENASHRCIIHIIMIISLFIMLLLSTFFSFKEKFIPSTILASIETLILALCYSLKGCAYDKVVFFVGIILIGFIIFRNVKEDDRGMEE